MFVDTPTDTPADTLTDSPAALYTPASPQPCTAEQCVLIWEGGGKTQTNSKNPLPVKSLSKLLCFPEMVMLLHSLGRF